MNAKRRPAARQSLLKAQMPAPPDPRKSLVFSKLHSNARQFVPIARQQLPGDPAIFSRPTDRSSRARNAPRDAFDAMAEKPLLTNSEFRNVNCPVRLLLVFQWAKAPGGKLGCPSYQNGETNVV